MTARDNEKAPSLDECIEWIGTEDGLSAPNAWPRDAYLIAIERHLLSLRTSQEWVDVRERLPKERGTYLATSTGSPWHDHISERPIVQLLYFDGADWEDDESIARTVTAWRVVAAPYSPPPKGEAP